MATNMSMSGFSSYSVSPGSCTLSNDFSPYVNVKTEADHSFSPGHRHVCNHEHSQRFSNNPHSLSSCMYAASVSPCMLPSPSSDHCSSLSAKENSDFRAIPSCRRRLDFNHNAFVDVTKVGPVAVAKRNERERNRVKMINMTFQTLRQHLPLGSSGVKGKSRKLSKVQTLRSAIDYIRQLQDLVHTRQQHQHLVDYRSKVEDETNAMLPCSEEFPNPYQGDTVDIRSPSKLDDSKGYFICQTLCRGVSKSLSNELPSKLVACSRPQKEGTNSSTTNSNAESPYSDASSYDAVTTPEDGFIDFDDWF